MIEKRKKMRRIRNRLFTLDSFTNQAQERMWVCVFAEGKRRNVKGKRREKEKSWESWGTKKIGRGLGK